MVTARWCSEVIPHPGADHQSKRRPPARRMGGVNEVFGALLACWLVGRRLSRLRRSLAEQVLQIGAHLLGVKTGGRRRRGLVWCVHALTLSPAQATCRINPANVSVKQKRGRVNRSRKWREKNSTQFFKKPHGHYLCRSQKHCRYGKEQHGDKEQSVTPQTIATQCKKPRHLGCQGSNWAGRGHLKRLAAPARPGYFTRLRNTEGLSAWPRPVPSAIGSSRATLLEDTFAITELTGATPTDPSASTVSSYTVQTLLEPV